MTPVFKQLLQKILKAIGLEWFSLELLVRLSRFCHYGFRGVPPIFYPYRIYGDSKRHVFFGYYDLSPFDFEDKVLLAMRAGAKNLSPKPEEHLEIGYYLIDDPSIFHIIDRTTAWCWQQGCRLQWYPLADAGKNGRIIYNVSRSWGYGAVIRNIKHGVDRELNRPVYACTPDGDTGYGLNFSRLQRLRPGYGYVSHPDMTINEAVPSKEGLYSMDMQSGHSDTLFTVADIAAIEPEHSMKGARHYFNHICCSPDGNRFLFFHLWLDRGNRRSRMLICKKDGAIEHVTRSLFVSHYAWETPESLLCYCKLEGMPKGYIKFDLTAGTQTLLGKGILEEDGHPSYVLGSDKIVTDTGAYNRCNEKRLLLLDREMKTLEELGRFYMSLDYSGEVRCDLHPRVSPSGRLVCIDSAHLGRRAICVMNLN